MYHDGGVSQSPDKLTGTIGKKFNMKAEEYPPPVKFIPIKGKVEFCSQESLKDLNKDLQLLIGLSLAVQSGPGNFDPELLNRKIGHVHKARWHNNCTSILKQYMTNARPSIKLKRLCVIILNWYVPFLLYIRAHWKLQDGAKCYWYGIVLASHCFEGPERNIFKKKFSNGSYFAHPEWILTAALFDPDFRTRQKAVNYIKADRIRRSKPDHVRRKFAKPEVNFTAKTYWTLCDFMKCDMEYITEPPITFDFTMEELQSCVSGVDLVLPDIPIHSVNNERAVQETSKACRDYDTYEKRLPVIHLTMKSRENLPTDASKRHFK